MRTFRYKAIYVNQDKRVNITIRALNHDLAYDKAKALACQVKTTFKLEGVQYEPEQIDLRTKGYV